MCMSLYVWVFLVQHHDRLFQYPNSKNIRLAPIFWLFIASIAIMHPFLQIPGVLCIIPKMPEISVAYEIEKFVSVPWDRSIRDPSGSGAHFDQSNQLYWNFPFHFVIPLRCTTFLHVCRKFFKKIKNGNSHYSARFDWKMSLDPSFFWIMKATQKSLRTLYLWLPAIFACVHCDKVLIILFAGAKLSPVIWKTQLLASPCYLPRQKSGQENLAGKCSLPRRRPTNVPRSAPLHLSEKVSWTPLSK